MPQTKSTNKLISSQKWRASDLSLEGEWRASEEYPVSAIAAATTEGDSGGSVFTANCDGEIKEWGAGEGAFRQMTVLTVRRYIRQFGARFAGSS